MISYVVKVGDEVRSQGGCEYMDLFNKLSDKVDRAVIVTDTEAMYFERNGINRVAVMVCTEKNSVGAAKLFAKKILSSAKKVDFSSLEDAFEFAEKLDKMDLDEVAKFLR